MNTETIKEHYTFNIHEHCYPSTGRTRKKVIKRKNIWYLVLDDSKVSFVWDQGIMLINYQLTKETYTKSKDDARKDWQYLVNQGYKEVQQ